MKQLQKLAFNIKLCPRSKRSKNWDTNQTHNPINENSQESDIKGSFVQYTKEAYKLEENDCKSWELVDSKNFDKKPTQPFFKENNVNTNNDNNKNNNNDI